MSSHFRIGVAVLLACVSMAASVCQAGVNSWTLNGPPGGIFPNVYASSTSPNLFYATFSRSLHRSTDGGITWTALRHFESQVNGLAVDPSDGNRIYVTVSEHGLFYSEDAGQTFRVIAPVKHDLSLWGVGANASVVYYTDSLRMYRSTDRGQSWSEYSTPRFLANIVVDPQDGNLIYTLGGPNLVKSTDGGQTWSETAISGTDNMRSMVELSATQLLAAGESGLFRSNDAGATWSRMRFGSYGDIAVDRTSPGRAIVAGAGTYDVLVATSDYGATWTQMGTAFTHEAKALAIDALDSSRIVLINNQGVRRTANGGQTWTDAARQPIASYPSVLASAVAQDSKVYAFSSHNGLYSNSRDSQWQRLPVEPVLFGSEFGGVTLAVKPGAPNTIYLAPSAVGLFRSDDGGNLWSQVGTGMTNFEPEALAFDADDSNVMYAKVRGVGSISTPVDGLYRSIDGGANWSVQSTNLPTGIFGQALEVDPADGSRMFLGETRFGTSGGGLWRSTDRGVSWSRIAFNSTDVRAIAINPATPSHMFVGTDSGLHFSRNGGDLFQLNSAYSTATVGRPVASVVIDPAVPTTVYVLSSSVAANMFSTIVTSSSHVLRSVDEGQTWEVLRDTAVSPIWPGIQLMLDPNLPSLLYVAVGARGIATMEIAPDLSLQLTGHSGVRAENVESSFHVRAINNGPYAATVVRVTANLPVGLTGVGATADGGACTVATAVTCEVPVLRVGQAINVVVRYTPTQAMSIPVTATVAAHENDAVPTDNSMTAAAATTDQVVDLNVTMQPSATTVTTGSNVTYTVNVSNAGPTAADNGTLEFTLGAGFGITAVPEGCNRSGNTATCTLSVMAGGGSRAYSFSAVASQAGVIMAGAVVTPGSLQAERNGANNSTTVSVTSQNAPSGGGSKGGGGAIDLTLLLALLMLMLMKPSECRNLEHRYRGSSVLRKNSIWPLKWRAGATVACPWRNADHTATGVWKSPEQSDRHA